MRRRTLRQIFKATFRLPSFKVNPLATSKRDAHTAAAPLFKSASCPDFDFFERYKREDRTQFINDNWLKARSATNFAKPFVVETTSKSFPKFPKADVLEGSGIVIPTVFESIANAVCPCPCPCGPCGPCCGPCGPCCGNMSDCNCGRLLPPPCNTPPKCIQYMQGYYYYPYGTWFCGPYHVNTGAVPCCGPVCPGTACGIAPPNPNLLCKCCCGLLSCSICNPPGPSSGSSPLGSAFPPFANNNPNVTSCFGPQGFAGLPCSQMSPAMSGPQLNGMPCSQQSWGQPQAPMAPSSMPPLPFGVPGSTVTTPMAGGSGFHVSFPPIPISPSVTQGSPQMPTSMSFPSPAAPQWATHHGPCECAECVAKRSMTETKSMTETQVDTQKAMQSLIEPFSKAFPTPKRTRNVGERCKEPPKSTKIMEDPKVKASFPLGLF